MTILLAILLSAAPAFAPEVPLQSGAIIVAGIAHPGIPEDASARPFRVLDSSLNVTYTRPGIFEGVRFVLDASHLARSITGARFNPSFEQGPSFALAENQPLSIAVAKDGRTFILGGSGYVSVFAADGTPSRIAPSELGSTGSNIDLAADQCTLLFTGASNRVRRYDVCHRAAAADFANEVPGGYLRALSDGGVAVLHSTGLDFYDASGRRTFTLPLLYGGGWFTFDSNPGMVWINNGRFRLSDGKLIDAIEAEALPQSFAVVDEHIPSSTSMLPRRRAAR